MTLGTKLDVDIGSELRVELMIFVRVSIYLFINPFITSGMKEPAGTSLGLQICSLYLPAVFNADCSLTYTVTTKHTVLPFSSAPCANGKKKYKWNAERVFVLLFEF